jgi:CelD/BcsL family acetyltransferase involved in cellulose biosynthesis
VGRDQNQALTLIPRLLHWVWLGGEPLPEQRQRWLDGWLELHPGWDHVLWTEKNLPALVNAQQFELAHSWAQQADVARYELLYSYGGVYLDTDVECLSSIEPLLANSRACIASDDQASLKQVGTSMIAAVPGHPWVADLVSAVPSRVGCGRSTPGETGAAFVTKMTVGRPDVRILPESVLREVGRPPTGDTRAIHHPPAIGRTATARGLQELVESLVPTGSLVALVGKGDEELTSGGGRRFIPLPERDGVWAGYPADDEEALAELQRLITRGVSFVVVPGPMFYWLNAYPGLNHYLWEHERCVLDSESALIFALESRTPTSPAPSRGRLQLCTHTGRSPLRATVIRTLSELQGLVPEWRELAAACAPSSTFQLPEWVVPWWEAFGAGRELLVVAIYDSNRLAGLLPLMSPIKKGRLEFIGDPLNYRNGMLAAVDDLEPAWRSALDSLSALDGWKSLEFSPAPDADVRACLALESPSVSLLPPVNTSVIYLPSTWEAYLERLPKNRRRQWLAALDELAASHEVELVCLTGAAITGQQLHDFYARRIEQWQEAGRFDDWPDLQRSAAFPAFLVRAGTALARLDHLVLTHLLVDGRPIASDLLHRWGTTVLGFMQTYDRRYARLGPGMLCTLLSLRHFIASGVERHDFGYGPEEYKFDFRAVRRELGGVRIRR